MKMMEFYLLSRISFFPWENSGCWAMHDDDQQLLFFFHILSFITFYLQTWLCLPGHGQIHYISILLSGSQFLHFICYGVGCVLFSIQCSLFCIFSTDHICSSYLWQQNNHAITSSSWNLNVQFKTNSQSTSNLNFCSHGIDSLEVCLLEVTVDLDALDFKQNRYKNKARTFWKFIKCVCLIFHKWEGITR